MPRKCPAETSHIVPQEVRRPAVSSDTETESKTEDLERQKSDWHINSIQGEENRSFCFSAAEEPSVAWEPWKCSSLPPPDLDNNQKEANARRRPDSGKCVAKGLED